MNTYPERAPWPLRLLRNCWRALNFTRQLFFNLLFLLLLLALLSALAGRGPALTTKGPLLIAPAGALVDQYSYVPSATRLLGATTQAETLLREVIHAVDTAAGDDDISAILLQLDYLAGAGVSKLQELGAALQRFRATGKPVIAFADNYSQEQYLLASYADEIHLHSQGTVLLTGFGVYRHYLAGALDKLAVQVNVFKVGNFKDFVEPYIRNDMSEASKAHTGEWLGGLWGTYTAEVERARQLPAGAVDRYIDQMAENFRTSGNAAKAALAAGLVDRVSSRVERDDYLAERFGTHDDGSIAYVDFADYRANLALLQPSDGNIGLIVARGTILDGEQPEGTIGGDTVSGLIREARRAGEIQALVVRVDSGGGSAFASELIRAELAATRAAGIPVVISMGSVAASGGYWLSMGANKIFATPSTLTGSIGVFSILPTFEQTLAKLGVTVDGLATSELAGALRLDRQLPQPAAAVLQQSVDNIYAEFLTLVAENRGTTPAALDNLAQGRVWTGTRALELGLVDATGYLDDALQAAAELAGVEQVSVKLIERELTPQERFMKQLLENTEAANAPSPLISFLNRVARALEPLFETGATPAYWALCAECPAL